MKRIRIGVLGVASVGAALAQSNSAFPLNVPEPTVSPTIKEFPRELLRNFRALSTSRSLVPLMVGGIAAGGVSGMDGSIDRYFSHLNRPLARVGNIAGNGLVAGGAIGGLLLLGQNTENEKFRDFTWSLAQGFVVNHGITSGMKTMTRRSRPDGRNLQSFPSGHTSTSFMWATVVAHHYGWKAGIPAYLAASYVGASRLSHKSHHLTDVVAGAALGYLVGATVARRAGYDAGRRINWTVGPVGAGIGAGLEINLNRRP